MGNGEQMTFEAFWRANRNVLLDQESVGGHGPAEAGELEDDTLGQHLQGAPEQEGAEYNGQPESPESSRGPAAAPRVHLEMPVPEPSSTLSPTQILNCDSWAQ